jgi:hypothetical protein
VPHVPVLLEVMPQRHVEKRPAVRGQGHRRGEPAVGDGQIAPGEETVQPIDVPADLQPVMPREAAGVDPRPGHDDHPQPRHRAFRDRVRVDHPPQQIRPRARAPHRRNAEQFPRAAPLL